MAFIDTKSLGKNPLCNKYIAFVVIIVALVAIFAFNSQNQDNNSSSANLSDEKINEMIANWIDENPQAIIESVQKMQQKAMEEQLKNAQKNIGKKKDELYNDDTSPQFISSKNYDVTIVEFFDYSCGYCKRASATIEELLKEDKKIRFIHKHYPILGEPSQEMAQVALAVNISQPKYYNKFHKELMASNERGKAVALKIAKNVGADVAKIEQTLQDKANKIQAAIANNIKLGSSIGVTGTPGFVIGEELIPGAIGLDQFKAKIEEIRKK